MAFLKQKIKIILNQRKQIVSCLKITLDFKGGGEC